MFGNGHVKPRTIISPKKSLKYTPVAKMLNHMDNETTFRYILTESSDWRTLAHNNNAYAAY